MTPIDCIPSHFIRYYSVQLSVTRSHLVVYGVPSDKRFATLQVFRSAWSCLFFLHDEAELWRGCHRHDKGSQLALSVRTGHQHVLLIWTQITWRTNSTREAVKGIVKQRRYSEMAKLMSGYSHPLLIMYWIEPLCSANKRAYTHSHIHTHTHTYIHAHTYV